MAAVLSRASSATRPTVAAIHVFSDARSSRRDSAMTAAATRHTPAAAVAQELNAARSSHFKSGLTRRSSACRFAATRHLRSADAPSALAVPPRRLGRPPAATAQSERRGAALLRPRAERRALAEWRDPAAAARSLRVTAARCVASAAHVAKLVAAARRLSAPPPPAAAAPSARRHGRRRGPPDAGLPLVARRSRQPPASASQRARAAIAAPLPGCPPAHDARRSRGVHCLWSRAVARAPARACSTHEPSDAAASEGRARRRRGRRARAPPAVGRRRTPRVGGAAGGARSREKPTYRSSPTMRRLCADRVRHATMPRFNSTRRHRATAARSWVARRVLQPGGHAPRAARRWWAVAAAASGARAAKRVRRRRKERARRPAEASASSPRRRAPRRRRSRRGV